MRTDLRYGLAPNLSDLKTALYIPWRGRWRLTQLTGEGLLRRRGPTQTRSKGQRGATRVTYPSGVTQIEEAPGRLWLVQWTEKPRRLRGGKWISHGCSLRCTEPAGFVACRGFVHRSRASVEVQVAMACLF